MLCHLQVMYEHKPYINNNLSRYGEYILSSLYLHILHLSIWNVQKVGEDDESPLVAIVKLSLDESEKNVPVYATLKT